MQFFISILLALAVIMSLLKLILLPRIYGVIFVVSTGLMAWLFQESLASSSLISIIESYSSLATLQSWCVILVIQELLASIAATKILQAQSLDKKIPAWTLIAFAPSILVVGAILWLKLFCFNYFLLVDFTKITMVLSISLVIVLTIFCESIRFFCKDRESLIELILQGELFFILLGIFLPVIAQSEIYEMNIGEFNYMHSMMLLIAFTLIIIVTMIANMLIIKVKNKRIEDI